MADLGNLYFGLHVKDLTDKDLKKIEKKLLSRGMSVKLVADTTALIKSMRDKLKSQPMKVDVMPNIRKSVKADLDVDKQYLRKSVKDSLKGQEFKAKLSLVVNKASVQDAVRQAFAKAGLNYNTTASDVRQQRILDIQARMAERAALAQQRLANAQAAGRRSTERHTSAMEEQSRISGQLRNQLLGVYSVYSAERFLRSVIEIGGEFQKQHIALNTMLGDAEKADAMFSQIKKLAIDSPFNFSELMGFTKQIAAFGIPYEEMYETTKRLADISAALGVDMGRIILAYGQVRSAAFLRGQELRQFTEAGIPLVDELAKKFSELEGRIVSSGEVFKKISGREVSFDMVKEVLWQLTDEGGKFYNMQEVLTESLSGKLSKLKDSYEMMLSNIAEANKELLGGGLDMLTAFTDRWRDSLDVVMQLIIAYGSYKTALMLINAVQKANLALNQLQFITNMARAMQGLTTVTKAQALAQGFLNKAMMINPYVAAAAAIATLSVGLYKLATAESAAEKATRRHNEAQQQFAKTIEDRKQKAESLIHLIQNESSTEFDRNKAYQELSSLYPALTNGYSMQQIATLKLADAQKTLNEENNKAEYENIIANMDKARESIKRFEALAQKASMAPNSANLSMMYMKKADSARADLEKWKQELAEYRRLKKQAEENEQPVEARLLKAKEEKEGIEQEFKSAEQELKEWQRKVSDSPFTVIPFDVQIRFDKASKSLNEINRKIQALKITEEKQTVKNESYFESIIRDAEDAKSRMDVGDIGSKRWEELTETIRKAKEQLNKFSQGNGENQEGSVLKMKTELDEKAKEKAKEEMERFLKQIERQVEDTTAGWNLYKHLFDATGDKEYSMSIAFSNNSHWDEAALQMKEKLKSLMKERGMDIKITFSETEEEAEKIFGENAGLYKLWEETKSRIEQNGIELKVNAANAIRDTMSLSDRIKSLESKRDEELGGYKEGTIEYDAVAEKWNKEIIKLKGELAELSPAFKELFVNTSQMAIGKVTELWGKAKSLTDLITENTTRTVRNEDGEATGRFYKDKDGNEQYISEDTFRKLQEVVKSLRPDVSDAQLAFERLWKSVKGKGDEGYKFADVAKDISTVTAVASTAAGEIGSMFAALGNENLADAFSFAGEMLSGVSALGGAASAFASGNILGGITGTISGITGIVGSIAAFHDKKLDKAINKSKERVDALKASYDQLNESVEKGVGSMQRTLALYEQLVMQAQRAGTDLAESFRKPYEVLMNGGQSYMAQLQSQITKAERLEKILDRLGFDNTLGLEAQLDREIYEALQSAGVGSNDLQNETLKQKEAQYVSLLEQRKELQLQMANEEKKKDADSSKIQDYQAQIAEMNAEISYFVEDLTKELFGIDFSDWSSQISDALVNAFANGENAAEAFKDVTNNIMKGVANNILKTMVIEPMFASLQKKLFGDENGQGGLFKTFEDIEGNGKLLASAMKEFFESEGGKMLSAAQEFLDALDKASGGAISSSGDKEESGGLSKGVEGITEETSGLIASYVNAVRADVSMQRIMQEKFFNNDFPKFNAIAQAQLRQLDAIARNTGQNVRFVQEIRDILHRNVNGTNKFNIK